MKSEWGLDETIAIVMQHEEIMRKSKTDSPHIMTHNQNESFIRVTFSSKMEISVVSLRIPNPSSSIRMRT